MSQVLHEIEKKIILTLTKNPTQTQEQLGTSTDLSTDQIRRGIEWLKLKGLANVDESTSSFLRLGKNGLESLEKGLPERRLINMLKDGPKLLSELQKEIGAAFGPAMGLARKNMWIHVSNEKISVANPPTE